MATADKNGRIYLESELRGGKGELELFGTVIAAEDIQTALAATATRGFSPMVDIGSGPEQAPSARAQTKEYPMSSPKPLLLTAVVALIVMGSAIHAQAQTVVKCKIPFEFALGGEVFPSGVYTLTTSSSDRFLLVLRNWAANQARFISVQREDEALGSDTLVKFNRYGDHYFLSNVVIAGDGISLKLRRSRAEREMAVRTVGTGVTVVANH